MRYKTCNKMFSLEWHLPFCPSSHSRRLPKEHLAPRPKVQGFLGEAQGELQECGEGEKVWKLYSFENVLRKSHQHFSGANVIKLFCPKFTDFRYKLECLFLASLSNLVQCLWVRSGAYPSVEHLKSASLRQTLALFTNITLSWKGLPGTNTLAYYKNP